MKDKSWPGRKYFQNISDKDLVYRIKKKELSQLNNNTCLGSGMWARGLLLGDRHPVFPM